MLSSLPSSDVLCVIDVPYAVFPLCNCLYSYGYCYGYRQKIDDCAS